MVQYIDALTFANEALSLMLLNMLLKHFASVSFGDIQQFCTVYLSHEYRSRFSVLYGFFRTFEQNQVEILLFLELEHLKWAQKVLFEDCNVVLALNGSRPVTFDGRRIELRFSMVFVGLWITSSLHGTTSSKRAIPRRSRCHFGLCHSAEDTI